MAVASFAPKSKLLLRDIATLEKDYDSGSCCGPAPTKPDVFVIKTDASDELEELGERFAALEFCYKGLFVVTALVLTIHYHSN